MGNERLRGSISAAGLTFEAVASKVGVDPKTVERWITTERVPHRGHRWKTAELLGKDETYLWPSLSNDLRVLKASDAELVQVYPNRGAVPLDMWRSLVDDATDGLDILVYSGLFLWDSRPELASMLASKASQGTRIRLLFGDPSSPEVARRGDEEGTTAIGLASRINIALNYLRPVSTTPGLEIKLHSSILYNSIYRSDASILVNTHAYGAPAAFSPVLHLQRVPGGKVFDHYMESFERVWNEGKPVQTNR